MHFLATTVEMEGKTFRALVVSPCFNQDSRATPILAIRRSARSMHGIIAKEQVQFGEANNRKQRMLQLNHGRISGMNLEATLCNLFCLSVPWKYTTVI